MTSTRILKKTIGIIIFAIILSSSPSCVTGEKVSQEVKEAEKVQQQQEKEAKAEYEEAVKKHRKEQSNYAKHLMKDMKKQQKKNNLSRKRSLWDRLFNRNCPTGINKKK